MCYYSPLPPKLSASVLWVCKVIGMGFRTCFSDKTPHLQAPLTCQELNLRLLPQNWHCLESKAISTTGITEHLYLSWAFQSDKSWPFQETLLLASISLRAPFWTSLKNYVCHWTLLFCGFKFTASNLSLLIPLWIWGWKEWEKSKEKGTKTLQKGDIFLLLKDGKRHSSLDSSDSSEWFRYLGLSSLGSLVWNVVD